MLRKLASYALEHAILPSISYEVEKVFDKAIYFGKSRVVSYLTTPVWLNRHHTHAREFFTANCEEIYVPVLTPILQVVSIYTAVSPDSSVRFNRSGAAHINRTLLPIRKGKDKKAAFVLDKGRGHEISSESLTLVRYKAGYILMDKDMIGISQDSTDHYYNNPYSMMYLIGVGVDELAEDMAAFNASLSVVDVNKVYFHSFTIHEHVAAQDSYSYSGVVADIPNPEPRPFLSQNGKSEKRPAEALNSFMDAWQASGGDAHTNRTIFRTRESMEYALKRGVRILGVDSADVHFPSMDEGGFKGTFYPPQVMDIVDDIRLLLSKADWYSSKGVAINMGVLLHGPAGTGKSTLAGCIGREFGIPVHLIYLNGQSDASFIRAWDSANSNISCPKVILIEDIDNVFNKREPIHETCTLSFDTLLNKISGVSSMENVILIITTNRIDYVDEAIGQEVLTATGEATVSRPGRIERIVHLGPMEEDCRRSLIKTVLEEEYAYDAEDLVTRSEGMTCAQVKDLCTKYCTQKLKEEIRKGTL